MSQLEDHVLAVWDNGDRKNPVFVGGVKEGKGRGAGDRYDVLFDLPGYLCEEAQAAGLSTSGPSNKFFAKDIIMPWRIRFCRRCFPQWQRTQMETMACREAS